MLERALAVPLTLSAKNEMLNSDAKIVNFLQACDGLVAGKSDLQILICGIGGQGGLHLGHNLAKLVADRYQDIFSNEIRGIAQKRASVTSMIRCGNGIRSAFFAKKNVDYVLALEPMEIMRLMPHIGPSTICILLDTYAFVPLFGVYDLERPTRRDIEASIYARGGRVIWLAVEEWLKSEKLTRKYAADIMAGAFAITAGYTLEEVTTISVKAKSAEEDKTHQHAIAFGFLLAGQQLDSVTPVEPSIHLHLISEDHFAMDKSPDIVKYEFCQVA